MYKTRFSWAGDGGIEGLYPAKRPSVARLVDVLSGIREQNRGLGGVGYNNIKTTQFLRFTAINFFLRYR